MPEVDAQKHSEDFISVIYNQKNDSPKYIELKKSKILLFIIGLPTITLISLILGGIGLVHTSPFHLIDTYQQDARARDAIAKTDSLIKQIKNSVEEKILLEKKLILAEEQLKSLPKNFEGSKVETSVPIPSNSINSIGLSTLSLFRPIQGQKDLTRPATLNLSGFKIVENRDTTNLQFNIIPTAEGGNKLAGHIIVLMKNELTIQVYPQRALLGNETQINYSSGEPFATQRFRPVDASFLKPRKPGNYTFAVYIFARNGDLLHYQSLVMPVKF